MTRAELADEIARAAIHSARHRWTSFACGYDDPPQLWAERWSGDSADNVAAGHVIGYARGLLDARAAAPPPDPASPQTPSSGQKTAPTAGVCGDPHSPMPEFW